MCTLIVTGSDAAPTLDPAEHDLDAVARAVEQSVVRDGPLATARRWNAGSDAPGFELGATAGTVVAVVGDQFPRSDREAGQHESGTAMVTGLAFGEQEYSGPTLSVAGGV